MQRLIPAIALSLAGCTTVGTYKTAVDETVWIDRPIQDVSQCFQLRLGVPPITTPDGATAFPLKNNMGSSVGMFSLFGEGQRTRIDIRRATPMVATGTWRNCR